MPGLKQGGRGAAGRIATPIDPAVLQDHIAIILLEAFNFVPPSRVSDTVRTWLERMDLSVLPARQKATLMTDAFMMASMLAVFSPSASGTTAIDRLARVRTPEEPADAAATAMLRQTQFMLLAVLDAGSDGTVRLRDMASAR